MSSIWNEKFRLQGSQPAPRVIDCAFSRSLALVLANRCPQTLVSAGSGDCWRTYLNDVPDPLTRLARLCGESASRPSTCRAWAVTLSRW